MEKMKTMKIRIIAIGLLPLFFAACGGSGDSYTPKPTTYYRITLPDKAYEVCDTAALGFTFERASKSQVIFKKDNSSVKWIDIVYPEYNGVLFLSCKKLKNTAALAMEVDTAYQLLQLHFQKSSGMDEQSYTDHVNKVYATVYRLKGQQIASTCQFWATDSSRNFVRGALYINSTPNYDSLKPVIDYLQADIDHLVGTIRWR